MPHHGVLAATALAVVFTRSWATAPPLSDAMAAPVEQPITNMKQLGPLITQVEQAEPLITAMEQTKRMTPHVEQVTSLILAHETPFFFVGHGTFADASRLCVAHGAELPMPETKLMKELFQAEIDAALLVGNLSHTWPSNTVWLGGVWDHEHGTWEWADGTYVPDGEKIIHESHDTHHNPEPKLCQLITGAWEDSEPENKFGVICEDPTWEAPSTTTTTSTYKVHVGAAIGGSLGAAGLLVGGLLGGLLVTTTTPAPWSDPHNFKGFANPLAMDVPTTTDVVVTIADNERRWLDVLALCTLLVLVAVIGAFACLWKGRKNSQLPWKPGIARSRAGELEGGLEGDDSELELMSSEDAAVPARAKDLVAVSSSVPPPAAQYASRIPMAWNLAQAVQSVPRLMWQQQVPRDASYTQVGQFEPTAPVTYTCVTSPVPYSRVGFP